MLRELVAEILWLAGAAALCWLIPKTFLSLQAFAALISIALWMVERKMTKNWD